MGYGKGNFYCNVVSGRGDEDENEVEIEIDRVRLYRYGDK